MLGTRAWYKLFDIAGYCGVSSDCYATGDEDWSRSVRDRDERRGQSIFLKFEFQVNTSKTKHTMYL
jgi:hypothetical protein